MSQFTFSLYVVATACAAGALVLLFALLTWRRVLARWALIFLLGELIVVTALLASPVTIVAVTACILVISLLAFPEAGKPREKVKRR